MFSPPTTTELACVPPQWWMPDSVKIFLLTYTYKGITYTFSAKQEHESKINFISQTEQPKDYF